MATWLFDPCAFGGKPKVDGWIEFSVYVDDIRLPGSITLTRKVEGSTFVLRGFGVLVAPELISVKGCVEKAVRVAQKRDGQIIDSLTRWTRLGDEHAIASGSFGEAPAPVWPSH